MASSTYVIATDLSPASRRAAGIAARLASRTHARLDFFCALPAAAVRDLGVDRVRAAVGAFANRKTFASGRPASSHVAVARDVPSAILRHVERAGADLLVVAPHGGTGWRKAVFGGVTQHVLHRAKGSVLVARGSVGSPFERVLVGVVPGPGGDSLLRHAIALARALDADLVAVHVVKPTELLLPRVDTARFLRTDDMPKETKDLRRWVASHPDPGVRIEAIAVEGSPAEMLVGESRRRRADIVVVGASEGSKLRRVLLGSVAYAVAAASSASVLVVRGGGNRPSPSRRRRTPPRR